MSPSVIENQLKYSMKKYMKRNVFPYVIEKF